MKPTSLLKTFYRYFTRPMSVVDLVWLIPLTAAFVFGAFNIQIAVLGAFLTVVGITRLPKSFIDRLNK